MSRRSREQSNSSNFTPSQLWIVIKKNIRLCVAAGVLVSLATFVTALFEVPYYESYSKIQFKNFNLGKSISQNSLQDSDTLGIREIMDRAIGLLRSDSFHAELASLIKENYNENNLVLAWAIGNKMRFESALRRFGFKHDAYSKIDLRNLSESEIAALLAKMIDVQPDYKEQSEIIKITALEPFTAQKINMYVATALMNANEKLKEGEIQKSISYLEKQREMAHGKLIEANDNLRLFYADNPSLVNLGSRSNIIDEKAELQSQRDKIIEQINSNKKLLLFYNKKYLNFSKNSDSTSEVYNKFKQELIELKYQRKKYIFDGYDEKNEGIIELDKKIKNLENILSNTNSDKYGKIDSQFISVGHDENLSEKIIELQESIKKSEFELESMDSKIKKISPQTNNISKSLLLLENLKSDIRMATELFEDLSKKCEYAKMRKGLEGQLISLIESPSFSMKPINIPIFLRVVFSFFVGMALAISYLILNMIFSTKIINSQSVEDLGYNFAGFLSDFDPDISEVLFNLDCLDQEDKKETPIVLCTSPREFVSYQDLILLTNYLARQNEKSLLILVGETAIHKRFSLVSDLGFAKIYAHKNNREYLLQVSDKGSIKVLRESIQILVENYGLKYSCIFLYFIKGVSDPNYHLGLKIASKVLLLGAPAKFGISEYDKLINGLKDQSIAHFCFAEIRANRELKKSNFSVNNDISYPIHKNYTFMDKVKGTFFDQ